MLNSARAEFLIEYLYPGMEKHWVVRNAGTFFAKYRDDLMSLDMASGEIRLSRDGILKYLPTSFISSKEELSGTEFDKNYQRMKFRRSVLEEALVPIDTFALRPSLELERRMSQLLDTRLDYVLHSIFDINLSEIESPLVRKAAASLPFVRRWRGNIPFVAKLLSSLTGYTVNVDRSHRHSEAESFNAWMPKVIFEVVIPGLDSESYKEKRAELLALWDFLSYWMLPYDAVSEIAISDETVKDTFGDDIMLDYNCKL